MTLLIVPLFITGIAIANFQSASAVPGGFSGYYDPSNWTFDGGIGGGSVDTVDAPDNIRVIGSDAGLETLIDTSFTREIPCDGTVVFDWGYETSDDQGPPFDPAGFSINGVFTQITDNGGADIQGGSESVPVSAGQVFGFVVRTVDDFLGEAELRIESFTAPLPEDCPDPDPTIGKTLVEGPEQIGIYLPGPTAYQYTIEYTGPAALVKDTVPAEFEILSAVSGDDVVTITNQGKGNKSQGATKIEWNVLAGTSTLIVDIQTVESPGKGHKLTVFKPTSCGALAINDGATAFEVNADGTLRLIVVPDPETPGETILVPVVIVGPSNSLQVEAIDGAKLCIEIGEDPNGK